MKSGNSRPYRDSNNGSSRGYLVTVPNTAELLHPTLLSLVFLGRPSINPLSQSTVCHLLETVDTRNLVSQNRKSFISALIATGVTWLITWGGEEGGPRRHRVLRCLYCASCKTRGFSYFCRYTTKIIGYKIFLLFLLVPLKLSNQKQKLFLSLHYQNYRLENISTVFTSPS